MTPALQGRRVLVVEDEYLLADDLRDVLKNAGAEVLGPVPDVDGALATLAAEAQIDAAVLDVNLGGASVFPVAGALIDRGVPIAFATGYDRSALPDRFNDVPRLEKPVKTSDLLSVLSGFVQS